MLAFVLCFGEVSPPYLQSFILIKLGHCLFVNYVIQVHKGALFSYVILFS